MSHSRSAVLAPVIVLWALAMAGGGVWVGMMVASSLPYRNAFPAETALSLTITVGAAVAALVGLQVLLLALTGERQLLAPWAGASVGGWVALLCAYTIGAPLLPARVALQSAPMLAFAPLGAFAWGSFGLIQGLPLRHRRAGPLWAPGCMLAGALGHMSVAVLVRQGGVPNEYSNVSLLSLVSPATAGVTFAMVGLATGLMLPAALTKRAAGAAASWGPDGLTLATLGALGALSIAQTPRPPAPEPLPAAVPCRFTGAERVGGFKYYEAPHSARGWSPFVTDLPEIVCYDKVVDTGPAGERWRMVAFSPNGTPGWLPEYELEFGAQFAGQAPYATATLSPAPAQLVPLATLEGGDPSIQALSYSPDGQTLTAAAQDGVRRWQAATGTVLPTLGDADMDIQELSYSGDGETLVTLGADGVLRWWDTAAGVLQHQAHVDELERTTSGHQLARADGGDTLFVSVWGRVGSIQRWNLRTHAREGDLATPVAERIWQLAVSPDGSTLACGTLEGTVFLIDGATGEQLRTLTGHVDNVWTLAFSRDSRLLASGAYDGSIRLWDVATGELVQRFDRHRGDAYGLAVGRDGRSIVSVGADGTLRVWDTATGKETDRGVAPSALEEIALRPDGVEVAAAGRDGTIYRWRLPGVASRP